MRLDIIKMWIYFKQGHSGYFIYIISIFNFMSIQYITWMKDTINIFQFITLFVPVYLLLSIIVGWFDWRKGSIPKQTMVSPFAQDRIKADILIIESLLDIVNNNNKIKLMNAKKLLRMWIDE